MAIAREIWKNKLFGGELFLPFSLDSIHINFEILGWFFPSSGISSCQIRSWYVNTNVVVTMWWFAILFGAWISPKKNCLGGSNGNWSCLFLIVCCLVGFLLWPVSVINDNPAGIVLSFSYILSIPPVRDSKTRHQAKINDYLETYTVSTFLFLFPSNECCMSSCSGKKKETGNWLQRVAMNKKCDDKTFNFLIYTDHKRVSGRK